MEVPVVTVPLPHGEEEEETLLFEGYKSPTRDVVILPQYAAYLFLATTLVVGVVYVIMGHLIRDLVHNLADYVGGRQPDEEMEVTLFEGRGGDKFTEDWTPETTPPELEEMARRAEEVKVVQEDNSRHAPVVWVISDGRTPHPPCLGTPAAFW